MAVESYKVAQYFEALRILVVWCTNFFVPGGGYQTSHFQLLIVLNIERLTINYNYDDVT